MLRNVVIGVLLAAAAVVLYLNRDQIAFLAGLDSNKVRIYGDWYEVEAGFKEPTRYTFEDEMLSRDGESCGQYHFRSHRVLEVTIDNSTATYIVEFPDSDNMEWYQEVKGELVLRRQWRR
jgi:hypothetical protein